MLLYKKYSTDHANKNKIETLKHKKNKFAKSKNRESLAQALYDCTVSHALSGNDQKKTAYEVSQQTWTPLVNKKVRLEKRKKEPGTKTV